MKTTNLLLAAGAAAVLFAVTRKKKRSQPVVADLIMGDGTSDGAPSDGAPSDGAAACSTGNYDAADGARVGELVAQGLAQYGDDAWDGSIGHGQEIAFQVAMFVFERFCPDFPRPDALYQVPNYAAQGGAPWEDLYNLATNKAFNILIGAGT